MSAYMVTRSHILTLANAARMGHGFDSGLVWFVGETRKKCESTDRALAARIANILSTENARSVAYRYTEEVPAEHFTARELSNFCPYAVTDPVQIIKAIHCLRYQSCEHPTWEMSEAFAILHALEKKMATRLPGYEDAPWGFNDYGPEARTTVDSHPG